MRPPEWEIIRADEQSNVMRLALPPPDGGWLYLYSEWDNGDDGEELLGTRRIALVATEDR